MWRSLCVISHVMSCAVLVRCCICSHTSLCVSSAYLIASCCVRHVYKNIFFYTYLKDILSFAMADPSHVLYPAYLVLTRPQHMEKKCCDLVRACHHARPQVTNEDGNLPVILSLDDKEEYPSEDRCQSRIHEIVCVPGTSKSMHQCPLGSRPPS